MPAVFEALNKQTVVPKKWILVLSEEEWPNLVLSSFLEKLVKRGLEIVWVKNNTYAVKKLVPIIEKYPELAVITLDDDIIYEQNLIGNLVKNVNATEGCVVGHVGKTMIQKNKKLQMLFRDNKITNSKTNSAQVFLIGWGGIYYPSNALSKKVIDKDAIQLIVPGRGSDIWFWAAAIANNTNQYCIEAHNNKNLGIPIPSTNSTKPKDTPPANQLEERFQMTIVFF
ncbi:hypothetical protein [Flavobacterium sp. ACAM 123]|uniref:hypothetical protein n=1 Tax=Flavobacterium sp. ACAM 123 TaxID=1189620 RepID=UPI0002ED09FB|nr:hypothetical protein [Flavobacterium sp. ACAM 123]